MLEKKIENALNKQINEEFSSYYIYVAMSAWLEEQGFKGFSTWMSLQAGEEMTHAMKIYAHVHERGGKVVLGAIEAPKVEWKTPLDVFEGALKHEQHITACINDLVKLSRKSDDYATESMLQWFVTEQVEEESNAQQMVDNLRMVQGAPGGLFMLDREAGQRVPAAAPAA